MADVARAAGVSSSTVSYALSGKRPISEDTRERIQKAIERLEYTPHATARALAMAKTNVIGLLAPLRPGVDIHVLMEFVSGITSKAHDHDYDILLVTQWDINSLKRVGSKSKVDGLIVMDVESSDIRLKFLEEMPLPVVLIGRPEQPSSVTTVDFDFESAGFKAAKHLASLGHEHIALIASPQEVLERRTAYALRLRRGFERACDTSATRATYLNMPASGPEVEPAIYRLLTSDTPPTAFVIHNESAMPQVLAAIHALDKEIPRDVSVVAISPQSMLGSTSIPLTSLPIPAEKMGEGAFEMLLQLMDDDPEQKVAPMLFDPPMVEQGSAGKAPSKL